MSYPKTGHIVNAPVRLIGESVEMQRQFIMAVALGVIILHNVLSKHEAIGNVTHSRSLWICRLVIGIHLNIGGVWFLPVLIQGIKNTIVVVVNLLFIRSGSLHILVEEK